MSYSMEKSPLKLVYVTPALYMAGGVERVLTLKASYFADHLDYDVTIILTEGKGKPVFYPLSDKVKVINFELGFEELWRVSFFRKVLLYLQKQRQFKKLLTSELMRIRPDFTISMLRREINFLTTIRDGSKKIGELHVNRANYRNFEQNESNVLKKLFAKFWMDSLVSKLKKFDRLVVLTEKSKASWPELSNVAVIPDPLPFQVDATSDLHAKRVISIGRYAYQKGYDMLLRAWAEIEKNFPDWQLAIYGMGNQDSLRNHMRDLGIDAGRCMLNGPVSDVTKEYLNSLGESLDEGVAEDNGIDKLTEQDFIDWCERDNVDKGFAEKGPSLIFTNGAVYNLDKYKYHLKGLLNLFKGKGGFRYGPKEIGRASCRERV